MAPNSGLNPLNNMPELTQDRAPNQRMDLSRERVVSSIPRAPTSAAPGDSPYGAASPHVSNDQGAGAKPSSCPVDHGDRSDGSGYWEYPSPQQFYNALVRKGWETPEESVDMMVLIHNFLNERAWQEIVEWEKLAGSDVSQLQLARFQGKPGTLTPKARFYGWMAWLMPDRFSSEPPFDRHDWIVRRGPTDSHPEGEEVRYIIDYYSREDESDENEASFNLDVRPAISNLDSARLRWKKLMQEYESGELLAPFREPSSAPASSASHR
ncbi:holocytochrome-c synthase [Malassezia nana]|uniref:Holocytochrome c-type synthase n=1 Tax=Malassezia nana TaxID=180528 RepID=A0AAF0EL01_9BASI|nr:holocytochrome-c synthase [Malassezia nana]